MSQQPSSIIIATAAPTVVLFWLFAALSVAQTSVPLEPEESTLRPAFELLPYEEDWSVLRDPELRTDPLDFLKYISLTNGDSYLSFGGEIRPYYELYQNESWGLEPEDDNGQYLLRLMFHSDLHLGTNLRFFGQLKSCLEDGRNGGPRPVDEDKLDLHQGFLDLVWQFDAESKIYFRAGRQEFSFGSQRLVSTREGPNVRRSFDGARFHFRERGWNIDAFVTRPVETNFGVFDDSADSDQTFWGIYVVYPWSVLSRNGNIDLYYLGIDRKQAQYNQGADSETRHTVGARIWNEQGTIDYNFEFVYQFGSFGNRGDINAWTIASDTAFSLRNARFSPRMSIKADITSGDEDAMNPDLQTFHPLFPRGAYFGQLSPVGPLNHMDLHPGIELSLTKKFSMTFECVFFWRQSISDGLYGVSGNLERDGNLSRAKFVGYQPGFEVEWQLDPHTTLAFELARFVTGQFLKETPPDKDINYLAAYATYKF